MKRGEVEKIEQEYIRNGTTGLIASRNVSSTGEILAPLIQPTRTEIDFAEHIKGIIDLSPNSKYIFVMDQLNTHKSESLVRLIAQRCDLDETDLGIKDKSGILKNMDTRAAFLTDKSHDIRIVYTPKHSSWLNQIEIWFSIITRRFLNKRQVSNRWKNLKRGFDYLLSFTMNIWQNRSNGHMLENYCKHNANYWLTTYLRSFALG